MSSHSLPSFAQAFSALDDRDRALPPIHTHSHTHSRSPYIRHDVRHEARHDSHGPPLPPLKRESRKRALERDDSSEPSSPRIVKQEQDVDQLDPSPPPQTQPQPSAPSPAKPPRARQQLHLNTNVGIASSNANASNAGAAASTNSNTTIANANTNAALPPPPPSLVRQHPPSKRRRVTISGVAHPNMHTSASYVADPTHTHSHTPPPHTHTGPNTPISPVVMGFTIQRDPQAVEQVRAMLAVKQKQKALIESRRGSAAGLVGIESGRRGSTAGFGGVDSAGRRASVAAPSVTVNVVNPTPTTSTGPGPAPAAPPMRRTGSSPNGHRLAPTPPSMSPNARANAARTRSPSLLGGARVNSPSPHAVPSQSQNSRTAPLPPPPTSSSNLSPPSHHPHPQTHPHAGASRPHMPSPPQPAPPSSSSNTQSQNQPPAFVASQGLSALAHNLPPPPNSFARRRAGQLGLRGNKPADLMISPRESESGPAPSSHKTSASAAQHPPQSQSHSQLPHRGMQIPSVLVSSSYKMLQPAIQSAPPRPGQQPGRFPMALPSLPPALGVAGGAAQRGTSVRKTSGQVPPTPTRLSLQRAQGTAESASVRLSQPTGLPRVPRTATAASFATPHGPGGGFAAGSSTLMPRTPATLHRASGAGIGPDKAAFLAPFEQFFDALSDAQVLKGWFGEQLRRVGAVAKDGEAQVLRLNAAGGESGFSKSEVEALVREAVQQETRTWRDEVARLHAQVTELQEVLRDLRSGEGRPFEPPGSSGTMSKGKAVSSVNGLSPRPLFQPTPPASGATTFPTAPGVDSYTFPPVQRPPTAPSSAPMNAPPPSSSAALMDAPQRSISPPRPRDAASESASGGGTGSGYGRSASRSTASSPAPSLDGGMSRRLSVSAMRFEPQQPLPIGRDAPTGEKKREGRPDSKRTNSYRGGGGATAGSGSKSNAGGGGGGGGSDAKSDEHRNSIPSGSSTSGAPKRSESPMDEN